MDGRGVGWGLVGRSCGGGCKKGHLGMILEGTQLEMIKVIEAQTKESLSSMTASRSRACFQRTTESFRSMADCFRPCLTFICRLR